MFEEFEDFEGDGASAPSSDGLVVDADRLADVRRMMAGEGAMPTKVTPAMLDGLTHQELRALREAIDRKLPEDNLSQMNLPQELVAQYRLVKRLQDDVITDEEIPLNQRSQLAGQVASTLQQLVKMQAEFQNSERFRAIENLLIKSLKLMPLDAATEFVNAYEALGGGENV